MSNFYNVLGLEKSATEDEIKKAYRKLILAWHPDKAQSKGKTLGECEIKSKSINEAYETLRDPGLRKEYDASLDEPRPRESKKVPQERPSIIHPMELSGLSVDWIRIIRSDDPIQLKTALVENHSLAENYLFIGSLLYMACKAGKLKIAQELIEEKGVDPKLKIYTEHVTGGVFKLAVMSGNLELIKYLLEVHSVDIESQGLSGGTKATALSIAAKSGRLDVVEYLIQKGANLDPEVSWGNLLGEGIQSRNPKVVECLLQAGAKMSRFVLDRAFKEGNVEIIQHLLASRPTLQAHRFLDLPCSNVIRSGNIDLLRYLEETEGLDIFSYDGLLSWHGSQIEGQVIRSTGLAVLLLGCESASLPMMDYLFKVKNLRSHLPEASVAKFAAFAIERIIKGSLYSKDSTSEEKFRLIRYLIQEQSLPIDEKYVLNILKDWRLSGRPVQAIYLLCCLSQFRDYHETLYRLVQLGGIQWAHPIDLFRVHLNVDENLDREILSTFRQKESLTERQLEEYASVSGYFATDALFLYAALNEDKNLALLAYLLQDLGADLHATRQGKTPLQIAIESKSKTVQTAYFLSEYGSKTTSPKDEEASEEPSID